MSNVDLERLRVKHRYFIPIKREELTNAIFKELDLLAYGSSLHKYDVYPWTGDEHGNSIEFLYNYKFQYVTRYCSRPPKSGEVEKLVQIYDDGEKHMDLYFEAIRYRRPCLPERIYVDVIRSEEEGCELEVECLPTLYRVISSLPKRKIEENEIQDAYIECERFLRTMFLGGLSGTILAEKKLMLSTPRIQFLINDVSIRQITDKIDEMLDTATGEVLIFGWIGTILLKKLRELKEKGIQVKVITGNVKTIRQDPMRKEKGRAMKELISIIGKDHISITPLFHGRGVVVDNKVLIGSMDLDSYSLTGTRIEFATYTEDPEIVRYLRNYFNQIFTPWKEKKLSNKPSTSSFANSF